ncbi:MAG: hypothetical protein K8S98_11360 [Planctomycetes bacterium]|nr:hypothetical protein [Planctomycetota bacterium]
MNSFLAGCVYAAAINAMFLVVALPARRWLILNAGDSRRRLIARARAAVALLPGCWILLGATAIAIHVAEVGGPPVRRDYIAEVLLGAEPPPYAEYAEMLRPALQVLMLVVLLAPVLWTVSNLEQGFLRRAATRVELAVLVTGWFAVGIVLRLDLYRVASWIND